MVGYFAASLASTHRVTVAYPASCDNPKCLQTWPHVLWHQNCPWLRTVVLNKHHIVLSTFLQRVECFSHIGSQVRGGFNMWLFLHSFSVFDCLLLTIAFKFLSRKVTWCSCFAP